MIDVRLAQWKDLHELSVLFDSYRIFYEQKSDLLGAQHFLEERMRSQQSTIFLAFHDTKMIGFTQLYPSYSSVGLRPILILNDLFVVRSYRKKGIGEALLKKAKAFCKERKIKGLALETAIDNPAQKLYERLGWKKHLHCFHYFWSVE